MTHDRGMLLRELEQQIAGEVRFDRVSRALYATDASVYRIEPLGVIVPRTREDVVRAVTIARRHRVSITARGRKAWMRRNSVPNTSCSNLRRRGSNAPPRWFAAWYARPYASGFVPVMARCHST